MGTLESLTSKNPTLYWYGYWASSKILKIVSDITDEKASGFVDKERKMKDTHFHLMFLQQLLDIINLWNVTQGNIGCNRLVSHHPSLYCHRPERLLLLASVCFKGLRWVTSSIL